ncbi:hypothetical protein AX16_003745 [Volvariella volvacea WC 439]|nr:hypothetical protein AX16_003745 [Volvariella volvacea WC 439]
MSAPSSPARSRPLRIDTSHAVATPAITRFSTDSLAVPSTPTPSFLISSPAEPNPPTPVSPSLPKSLPPDPHSRARFESRKLLAHVLTQLQTRPMPPRASSTITRDSEMGPDSRLGAIMATVTGVVKFKQGRKEAGLPSTPLDEDSEDEEEDKGFSTETTYNLLLQLKDVLMISKAQDLDIFDIRSDYGEVNASKPSGFHRSRNTLSAPGKRSRSPSPAFSNYLHAPKLLSVCISVLASIVLEDCRYKVTSPRPTRPPNALQLLTLEIAQYLAYTQQHDPKILAEIGFAILPAFTTFPSDIHFRLLAFFESGIIRRAIESLGQLQGVESHGHSHSPLVPPGDTAISIQVDEVLDEDIKVPKWQAWPTDTRLKLLSTNAPKQPEAIYHLASLIPTLLSSIFENLDLFSSKVKQSELRQRVQRLLDTIAQGKIDACMDFLQVIAYSAPKARRTAISLIMAHWPKILGHVTISRPFNSLPDQLPTAYCTFLYDLESLSVHQFVPWCFGLQASSHNENASRRYDCRVCLRNVHEFGLLCPWCMTAVHFDCYDYPAGNQIVQYPMADENVRRVAMYRFSPTLATTLRANSTTIRKSAHTFRPVTVFTLCLCFACRMPLWGCNNQGLQCTSCSQFFHSHCLSNTPVNEISRCDTSEITSNHMVIDWSNLRSSCLSHYNDIFKLTTRDLESYSFEELSVLHSVLWTQLQLMISGIEMGTIIVMQKGQRAGHAEVQVQEFELHHMTRQCEECLSRNELRCSPTMEDYLVNCQESKQSHRLMFNWTSLAYITSTLKSGEHIIRTSTNTSPSLLNVNQADPFVDNDLEEDSSYPLEVAPLSHLRNGLAHEFGIRSDVAAKHLLSHLHHLSFFTRLDGATDLFNTSESNDVQCMFGLPLGSDTSTEVETLASAIEACLSDLDLAANEVGFLLLTRRFWPHGLMSDYALLRLSRALIYWILAEDDNLATILRDYVAKQRVLPGVRASHEASSWPSGSNARHGLAGSVNNGGDYVSARRTLLLRYVAPWLQQLHDQDPHNYASVLHNICTEYAQDDAGAQASNTVNDSSKKYTLDLCERLLHAILRLSQTSVTFSMFDELFVQWLDSVSSYDLADETIPSLTRLFPRDGEAHLRASALPDISGSQPDTLNHTFVDPWRVVMASANKSREGLSRSLRWLRVFAGSGVEIPDSTLLRFANLVVRFNSPLEDASALVRAALSSLWLKSLGRQGLQRFFSILHSYLAGYSLESLRDTKRDITTILTFVRQTLGGCLLLYGCERDTVIKSGLVHLNEVAKLPSRRKLNTRGMAGQDPILIDSGLLSILGQYIATDADVLSCMVAKFLDALLTDASLFEPHEIDNFILQNGLFFATCAWGFYGIQHHQIASVRTGILLRTLVVDPQPFQELLATCFQPSEEWEERLLAATRLFRIILDVISPRFVVEDRQWRSSVIDVFFHFFNSMWADEREEIRLTIHTLSSTLLPSHFEAIARCWTEAFLKAPFDERIKLISFLTQLHPHFPTWKVLSWDAILEIYNSSESVQPDTSNGVKADGLMDHSSRSTGHDREMIHLRVSTMVLALQLVADGISTNQHTLISLKYNLCQLLGYRDVSVMSTRDGQNLVVHFGEIKRISEHAYPCIDDLVQILDSAHRIEQPVPTSAMQDRSPPPTLVGAVFVDMTLALFTSSVDTTALPVLTIKNLLEALCIIIYKYDFDDNTLRHCQQALRRAVLRASKLMLEEVSFEVRQLALSVVQAFIKRWNKFMGSTIYASFESTVKLITSHSHHGQDALILQAKRFIESTLSTYSEHGLLVNLLKRSLDREFFIILKQILDADARQNTGSSLRDTLFRDTFIRLEANDIERPVLEVTLTNLQALIEVVHHQGYDHTLVLVVGQCIISLARRAQAEEGFDATSILHIPTLLIQHNMMYSREILAYTETLLRISLTRLYVPLSSLTELLTVTGDLYRKFAANMTATNPVALVVFEILTESLRVKTKILPSTLKALVEAVTSDDIVQILGINASLNLTEHGIHFLYHHDLTLNGDFPTSIAIARMILRAARHDPTVLNKFANYPVDKPSRQMQVIRAWNILLFAVVQDIDGKWGDPLLAHLPTFAVAHQNVLRCYSQPEFAIPETVLTDINHAYIALKLWIMVARYADKGIAATNVWQELWPPFESLVDASDKQLPLPHTFTTLVSSSIADLFFFLATLHTQLSLQTSLHINLLNKIKQRGRTDASTNKVTRALRALIDPPPEVPMEGLVDQIAKEIIAAEKLRMLETKRDLNTKTGLERR